jgi:hypothetical protein
MLSHDLSSELRTSLWVYQKLASLACKAMDNGGLSNSNKFAASWGEMDGAVPYEISDRVPLELQLFLL